VLNNPQKRLRKALEIELKSAAANLNIGFVEG